MKLLKIVAALALISNACMAQTPSSYFFLFDETRNMWCGYTNEGHFQDISGQIQPLESARVIYRVGALSEVTYQVQPESGDWIVIDKYDVSPKQTYLRRAFVFAQSGVQVVKEGRITKGGPNQLSLVSSANPDGSKASLQNVDFPIVVIEDDLSQFPFMKMAESMRKESLETLCMQVGRSQ